MLFEIALLLHIGGAIVGLGPTFAFAIIGSAAGKWPGEGAIALIETMVEISKKLVTPVALFLQPVTGLYLIFASGRSEDFFSFEWLWISIVLYIGVLAISYGLDLPLIGRILEAMRRGQAGTPSFQQMVNRTRLYGSVMGVSLTTIIVLMVIKPGGF